MTEEAAQAANDVLHGLGGLAFFQAGNRQGFHFLAAALTRLIPDRTRSWIIDRSNSAKTPMTPKSALPAGVVVYEEIHFFGVDLREEIDEV